MKIPYVDETKSVIINMYQLIIDYNITYRCDNFVNISFRANLWRYVKYRRYPRNRRNAQNWVQFRFNSTGDITGDIIFQQIIYRLLRIQKFTLKINNPAIPAIPGILYILLSYIHCNKSNYEHWLNYPVILWISRYIYYSIRFLHCVLKVLKL